MTDWIGDGFCDDEDADWGVDLYCLEFDYDGGDCGEVFDPSGDYEGTVEASLTYDYGWFEVRYECEGDLTGAVDMTADPQIEASGNCYDEDGEAYPIIITGNFDGETPSGTIRFDTDDPLEDSWSGDWAARSSRESGTASSALEDGRPSAMTASSNWSVSKTETQPGRRSVASPRPPALYPCARGVADGCHRVLVSSCLHACGQARRGPVDVIHQPQPPQQSTSRTP